MENEKGKCEGKCSCPCHFMMGIFVILFGLTFELGALGVISDHLVSILWPIFVILAGLKKLAAGRCKCCPKS